MSDFKVEMEKISTFPRIITLWVFPSQSLIAKNRHSRRWGLKYEIIKNILKKLHALFIWTLSFFMICWKIVCRQFRKQTDRPHNKQSPRLGRRAKSYKGDLELDNWKSQNYFHWFLHGNKPTMHVIRINSTQKSWSISTGVTCFSWHHQKINLDIILYNVITKTKNKSLISSSIYTVRQLDHRMLITLRQMSFFFINQYFIFRNNGG